MLFAYKKFGRSPGRKALVSIIKGYPSLPFMGIIAVCSETHAKSLSTLCEQNIELRHLTRNSVVANGSGCVSN